MSKRSVKKAKRIGKGFSFKQRVHSGMFDAMKRRNEAVPDVLMAKMLASGAILFQPKDAVESVTVEPVEATVTE